ncbi:hypothetical protein BV25DRAFT_1921274 [Artomyces pyxidatus]|uniref:Uncharacterized protein n=1 Tax=Artomyces pyxidatus TaxID=48021 RepID=A0ACB8SIL8_9AGAM|nr:hypothetical protein BV25DRAFT_1921274 [Artomyces pyxidatus]
MPVTPSPSPTYMPSKNFQLALKIVDRFIRYDQYQLAANISGMLSDRPSKFPLLNKMLADQMDLTVRDMVHVLYYARCLYHVRDVFGIGCDGKVSEGERETLAILMIRLGTGKKNKETMARFNTSVAMVPPKEMDSPERKEKEARYCQILRARGETALASEIEKSVIFVAK